MRDILAPKRYTYRDLTLYAIIESKGISQKKEMIILEVEEVMVKFVDLPKNSKIIGCKFFKKT